MNRFAYRTTGLAVKTIAALSRAKINIHGAENIPNGAVVFVINHFTRIETLLLPYHLSRLTGVPVWSLAANDLFKGMPGKFLESVGSVSTKNPHRDQLIVKSLLTGEAHWIIYPEGRMVKNKKIFDKGKFVVASPEGTHRPHTGAAAMAIRTAFYRKRLEKLAENDAKEAGRIRNLFKIEDLDQITNQQTFIVPVNVTYYPLRAKENALNQLAAWMVEVVPERMSEELMTEGSMLLSGVDIDIRFGAPISVDDCLECDVIDKDIASKEKFDFDDPIPSKARMRKEAHRLMIRYMQAIYQLTTVNHDHLFAAMIKQFPFRKIAPIELRRRVFWAWAQALKQKDPWHHKSLEGSQTHLLTDDAYHKYSDFLKIALDKEVLIPKDGLLIKNREKMSSPFDFHRVRIENPISVMANEVEPLIALQKVISHTAWLPRFILRRKIVQYLLKSAEEEFEIDYDQFYIEGESKPRDVGRPFLLRRNSNKIGVVLIHGYMAAPEEVSGLARYLFKRGLNVFVPRLRGHGTAPEDLAARTYKDWVQSVDRGYAIINSLCREVVVGGFSTGAGLALEMASRLKNLKGVFAIAPPLRLQDFSAKFVPAVDVWNRLMKRMHLDDAKMEFVENQPENPHINYLRNPIKGVRELDRLMENVEPRLRDIKIPAFIGQANQDPVVDPRGSRKVFDMLSSERKRYALFNFNRHGILLGPGSEDVYRAVGDFIERIK
jgi:esterase/lipase/1-acyl-sn-glycerol-3-phosphate acyltransferase